MTTIAVIDGISPALEQIAKEFPADFQRALVNVGQHFRKLIGPAMRAGTPHGETFAPLSETTMRVRQESGQSNFVARQAVVHQRAILRKGVKAGKATFREAEYAKLKISDRASRLRHKESNLQGFGGKLPNLVEWDTVGQVMAVGFIGKVFQNTGRIASHWMENVSKPFDTKQRHWLHALYRSKTIPAMYDRPLRSAVMPWGKSLGETAQDTIIKSMKANIIRNSGRQARMAT